MREKYETLSLVVLKELAKARGLRGVTGLKKADLINRMLEEDIKLQEQKGQSEGGQPEQPDMPQIQAQAKSNQIKSNQTDKNKDGRPANPEAGHTGQAEAEGGQGWPQKPDTAQQQGRQEETNIQEEAGRQDGKQSRQEETVRQEDRQSRQEEAGRQERPNETGRQERGDRQGRQEENGRQERSVQQNRQNRQEENGRQERGDRQGRQERGAQQDRTDRQDMPQAQQRPRRQDGDNRDEINSDLDSGVTADGILEVMPDGYGFIRCENYLPGEHDVYVSPSQIRRFGLKTGDIVRGNTRIKTQGEKFSALLYITTINGYHPSVVAQRRNFEDLTPVFPNERMRLETNRATTSMRIVDLVSPIGKGQRGMIVSPPKAGKTTLLKQVAQAIKVNNPEIHLIILLIDERPEEVTDIKEAIEGNNVEVIYSTFDELPEHHKRVSEMVIERAKRLVEHRQDVMILLDSITRLARAYNLTVPPSGRTLSGGLDPAALHMPKRFFGAARNMREGGSLTILATALVDTGSKMDDVVYEEFKGTGNMELVLDRRLSEKRIFPAIDIVKSSTRREDLLLDREEREAVDIMRKGINGMKTDEAVENILNMFARTSNNRDYIQLVKKRRVL